MKSATPIILIAFLVIVLGLLGVGMNRLIMPDSSGIAMREMIPILLVLGGVAGLLLFFVIAGLAFKGMGLADEKQAFGLPEGSVRAVVATMALLLFGIIPLFLFASLNNTNNVVQRVDNLTQQQAADLKATLTDSSPTISPNPAPPNSKSTDAIYTVFYRGTPSAAAIDLSKQFFVALATLVAAMSSFFFGSAVATSANKAGAAVAATASSAAAANANPIPTLQSVQPNKVVTSTTPLPSPTEAPLHQDLQIAGSGLDRVTKVSLVRASDSKTVSATDVTSNPGQIKCTVSLNTEMVGTWSVVVATSDSPAKTEKLDSIFSIS